MLTRIRLEASSSTRETVETELLGMAEVVRQTAGGEWVEEEPGLEIQTTKTGYWGRWTLRRKP